MNKLIKPLKLQRGDTIAVISPCSGIAGDKDVNRKYLLGKKRLEDMGLSVVSAPNSLKGEEYLRNHPNARAEDIMWAFKNEQVKAVIANIGGNDSDKVLPFLRSDIIADNPKIFIGYSDVMNYHLFCHNAGLSTFYGHNLLPTIAETPEFHPYSKHWFEKVLFDDSPIGTIYPAENYSCDENNYFDKAFAKTYHKEKGYLFLQGSGRAQGRLFGGHTGLRDFPGISPDDFESRILFIEDIVPFFSPKQLADFTDWLGSIGALQKLNGILIGKLCEYKSFDEHKTALLQVVNEKYGLTGLPIVANMNFGHTSPICIMPYGMLTEIDCDKHTISMLEGAVI